MNKPTPDASAAAGSTLAVGSASARDKERARQRAKYHANKDRYSGRDVAAGLDYFWAKRGGCPR